MTEDHALAVAIFSGAGHDEQGRVLYPVPEPLTVAFPGIQEIVAGGDFEGYLSFVVGINGLRSFRVSTLDSPLGSSSTSKRDQPGRAQEKRPTASSTGQPTR